MDELKIYIKKLLNARQSTLGLSFLEIKYGSDKIGFRPEEGFCIAPVSFREKTFGALNFPQVTLAQRVEIKDLALQLACLLNYGLDHKAIALDEYIENLAQAHCDRYHWAGIYLLGGDGLLFVASFRGESTPHLVIPTDSGICGAAVREAKTLNIADVGGDARYLSCSIKTKSEIVVPIFDSSRSKVVGEIDIDSHLPNAFSSKDERLLEEDALSLSKILGF